MDKKTLIAFVLIGVILVLMPYYQKFFIPEADQPAIPQNSESVGDSLLREIIPGKTAERGEKESTVRPASPPSVQLPAPEVKRATIPEREIMIDTPLYRGVLSTRGGVVRNWTLKKYTYEDGKPVEIVKGNFAPNMSIGIVKASGDTIWTHDFDFSVLNGNVENKEPVITVSFNREGTGFLKLRKEFGGNSWIEKEMTFYEDRYYSDVTIRISGMKSLTLNNEYLVSWGTGLSPTESDIVNDLQYSKTYALLGSELETYEVANGGKEPSRYDGSARWIATRSKYFAAAIIPKTREAKGALLAGNGIVDGDVIAFKDYHSTLIMPLIDDAVQEDKYQLLLGPLEYKRITDFNVDLERMMDFGWQIIRPIAKLIYHIFIFLHEYIPNYGIVIIVFSILLKIVFYPLTKASYKSMREMQKVQPELAKLKEKYKDDPQKLNKATMKLYQEHKVNPLGGCFPLLLQMPVFFALYPVLYSTIEFRAAPFFGWITDLSKPDTVYQLTFNIPMYGDKVNVLPIIWAISMLFQNMMTMKDPKQKFMVYVMPAFMLLFFNKLPSGLVLYWTVFNVFSLLQQMVTKDHHGSGATHPTGV